MWRSATISFLAKHFLERVNLSRSQRAVTPLLLGEEVWTFLQCHPWPGNVRELRHVIERLEILAGGGEIGLRDLKELAEVTGGRRTIPLPNAESYQQAKRKLLDQFDRL